MATEQAKTWMSMIQELWRGRRASGDQTEALLQNNEGDAMKKPINIVIMVAALIFGLLILKWVLPIIFWFAAGFAALIIGLMLYQSASARNRSDNYDRAPPQEWI